MCASLEMGGMRRNPGALVTAWRRSGRTVTLPWAGFARREILDWWRRRGCELADVAVERFAIRSDVSRELVWSDLPEGMVLRAIVIPRNGELRIVTRLATPMEMLHFQHERMPVVERALYCSEMPPTVGLPLFEMSRVSGRKQPAPAVQEMLL